MEVEQQIEIISNDLEYNYGIEIGEKYKSIVSLRSEIHNDEKYKDKIEELINIQEMTLNEDHKQKQINGLHTKIKKMEIKINEQGNEIYLLKQENKELKQENKELKQEIIKLNHRLDKQESLICITQVCKNIQYFIVQKITGCIKLSL